MIGIFGGILRWSTHPTAILFSDEMQEACLERKQIPLRARWRLGGHVWGEQFFEHPPACQRPIASRTALDRCQIEVFFRTQSHFLWRRSAYTLPARPSIYAQISPRWERESRALSYYGVFVFVCACCAMCVCVHFFESQHIVVRAVETGFRFRKLLNVVCSYST